MPWYSRRMLIGGAASLFLAVAGFSVVWNTMNHETALTELRPAPTPSAASTELPAREAQEPIQPQIDAPENVEPVPEPAIRALAPMSAPASESGRLAKADQYRNDADKDQAALAAAEADAREKKERAESQALQARTWSQAQPAAAPPPPKLAEQNAATEEITVSGMRRAPEQAMTSTSPVSVISAESMANAAPSTAGAVGMPIPQDQEYVGRDKFEHFDVNPVKRVAEEPVSTFSADVDTASYSFVRRQIEAGLLPQKDAVRVEEMVNYFNYSWPAAETRAQPFKPTVVVSDSPWKKGRKLVHIGIKGFEMKPAEQPDANLVLLMDVSGSMSSADRLPLAIKSMELLLGSLKPTDTVAMVVYAGAAGKVLDPTPVRDKDKILSALQRLQAGGSTAGAEGIKLAYELAESSFRKGGVNRILLATDGDFNVGIDSTEELKGYVERQREKGIFLSVLGFGMGNYRDEMAQALAQNGNGVAAYIDSLDEARKVLVKEATGSLFTIAKDVKFQVEFNPETVAEYRLVGYETRALKREDFNNDAVDAGDIGAGHTVTAIYEITPVGSNARSVDPLRFGRDKDKASEKSRGDANLYGFLKMRYKLPDGNESKLIEQPIGKEMPAANSTVQRDVKFSTAVAGFAQLLRGGKYTGKLTLDDVIEDADAARGDDPEGYRAEFVKLVRKAKTAKGM